MVSFFSSLKFVLRPFETPAFNCLIDLSSSTWRLEFFLYFFAICLFSINFCMYLRIFFSYYLRQSTVNILCYHVYVESKIPTKIETHFGNTARAHPTLTLRKHDLFKIIFFFWKCKGFSHSIKSKIGAKFGTNKECYDVKVFVYLFVVNSNGIKWKWK